MNRRLTTLEQQLHHSFNDSGLLEQALTHRSVGRINNERLEFLGDSLLNMVIAEATYQLHPELEEGDLSRMRASLVNQEALAEIARDLQLGDYLSLGPGELKSGGYRRASILADALEALLGAIHLDAGFEAARNTVLQLFKRKLENPVSPERLKDAKTRLQEWLQERNLELPKYCVESVSGEPHKQVFTVSCLVQEPGVSTVGHASSRRAAEQEAARHALEKLES